METCKYFLLSKEEAEDIKFLNGNRNVNKSHVTKLANDLKKGDGKYFPAIIVDENTKTVIDGQHRLTAYRLLWDNKKINFNEPIKVEFKQFGQDVLNNIIRMNQNQRTWKLQDFLDMQKKIDGTDSIPKLEEFCSKNERLHKITIKGKNKLCYRYACALLFGKNQTNKIKSGSLIITDQDIEHAQKLYDEADTILKRIGLDNNDCWIEFFFTAWRRVRTNSITSSLIDKNGFDQFVSLCEYTGPDMLSFSIDDWESYFTDIAKLFL